MGDEARGDPGLVVYPRAMLEMTAIVPTREIISDPTRALVGLLGQSGWAGDMVREMANYPQQAPAYGVRQTISRRGGKHVTVGRRQYRRSGSLGRNWRLVRMAVVGDNFTATVANGTIYGVWVQGPTDGSGPGQTDVMRSKGWQSVSDIGPVVWARWQPAVARLFTQADVPRRAL